MALTKLTQITIERHLRDALRKKMENYSPEPAIMPFHTRLLGKDRMALFSFIHSLNTNFGTSIFEPIAKIISLSKFKTAELQVSAGNHISQKAQVVIQDIMDNLTAATREPHKQEEVEAIRKVCRSGNIKTIKPTKVDIKLEDNNGAIFLFDIKTAKPNKGGFHEFKRTLLEWVAVTLYDDPDANVHSLIAIPYNPYEPKPYSRWTMKGMLDLEQELKVAEEFWDFLGGTGTYKDLLDSFEKVGVELRHEIDEYFKKYVK